MYENHYPNDYSDKNVIDSTAKEMKPENGNFSGQNVGANGYGSSVYGTTGNGHVEPAGNNGNVGAGSTANMNNVTGTASTGAANTGTVGGMNGSMNRTGSYQYGNYNGSYQTGNYGAHTNSYGNTYGAGGNMGGNGSGMGGGYQMNQPPKKEKEKKQKGGSGYLKKVLVAVSLGLFFGICAGVGFFAVESATGAWKGNDETITAKGAEVTDSLEVGNLDEAEVIEQTAQNQAGVIDSTGQAQTVVMDVSNVAAMVMPSIVSINNTSIQKMSYFGQTLESESTSVGSGIIVGESDTELLIVSNYHVVQDADTLKVQFVDGSEAEAQMKGSDPDMDLAVIAVPLESVDAVTREAIAVASLGDSDSLTVGEPAIAIGNALGYGQSVTVGVISAVDRVIDLSGSGEAGMNAEGGEAFIQTDAAINPGNSGGALLNMKGEVIGINSNKIGGSVVEGMGYAIPISAAKPIIEDLMLRETREKVAEENKGYLGIAQLTVVDEMAEAYDMPRGVYVSQVYEGTGAEAAGIVKGNIITEFDGNKITCSEDLIRVLEYYSVGDTVEVVLMQGSPNGWESKTVMVTLGEKFE